ncbi:MAG: hypothetical protein HRT89_02420 [Lentisphaeria bacterium]|nr:hypothetical protein [Lentisphaeria bacterium]NQZ66903.1 hypothetical protein [Lentisphaeria bacterium]
MTSTSGAADSSQIKFQISEHLGFSWASQLMHKTIHVKNQGQIVPGKCALFHQGKEIPMQLDNIVPYNDGSIKQVDVWFRTDMPANGKKEFELRQVRKVKATKTDLYTKNKKGFIELGNGITAVRIPVSGGKGSAAPILGIKLANGKWTGASRFSKKENLQFDPVPGLIQKLPNPPAGKLISCRTERLANGLIFQRYRLTYSFEKNGAYSMTVTIRSGDPVIYFDEEYKHAGALTVDFKNYKPAKSWYKAFRAHKGKAITLDYKTEKKVALLLGWDGYFTDISPAFIFSGAAESQSLAIISTDADWLPFPYNQALHLSTRKDGLSISASLQEGQRHWGIHVGQDKQYKDMVNEFYPWWWRNIAISMDKVLNWQLVWPGMETLEFPHTFFSKKDLPKIRQQLKGNKLIQDFMKKPKYAAAKSFTDAATVFLYNGDKKMLPILSDPTKTHLGVSATTYLEKAGFYDTYHANNMQLSDDLMVSYVGMELLLGDESISKERKRQMLSRLAFIEYITNDYNYWPPSIPFSPTSSEPYSGYVCGTPNQKICYLTARGIVAAMIPNHPEFKQWTDRAKADFELNVSESVAKSGVHSESPFYSSRDTMRFGPYWTAMKRAGVIDNDPAAEAWEARLKKCYSYIAQMLTPPEPRLGGRRTYHPIGRSGTGVIDPAIMISGSPFGENDPVYLSEQRWFWESQGKPSPDVMGNTGGRDMSLTILAFLPIANAKAAVKSPLESKRYKGFGLIGRSQVGTKFESNILFRQDPFCWYLYEASNGAVYFWGKGAPLSLRFGAMYSKPWMMSIPFGNRLIFDKGKSPEWTDAIGHMTDYCLMNELVDYGVSKTRDTDWTREILFIKDKNWEDPLFLLVRDDTSRKGSSSAVHWWLMSKDVQPNGVESVGVVPNQVKTDDEWIKRVGTNWKDAPKLKGQTHHFETNFNVGLDMFIASPVNPKIISDAAGFKPGQPYCVNKKMCEYQQLIRIEQGEGKHYLTLLSPTIKGEKRSYKTIAGGYGVEVNTATQQNRLFLAPKKISYMDKIVTFKGKAGFTRVGSGKMIRLMIINGTIESKGFTLSCTGKAGLLYDGKSITIYRSQESDLKYTLPTAVKSIPIRLVHSK